MEPENQPELSDRDKARFEIAARLAIAERRQDAAALLVYGIGFQNLSDEERTKAHADYMQAQCDLRKAREDREAWIAEGAPPYRGMMSRVNTTIFD